ncbi:M20/M25/M40 family metallo-hydrolase [Ornithinibacillus sp. 4-3]|uniref:M20/M25/M40 family metallo-hydrolase n=1 Tax=Ornithinibacillus sp. 4-3 TaxID=3231488 RepID=A0AB39HUI7_9BACI
MNKDFLMDLLHTASPSGHEVEVQKKWLNYTKQFADEIRIDDIGNAIAILNPDAKFKILLAGHCDEIGLVVNRIDEEGFLYFERVGGINPKAAVGMKVNVLTEEKTLPGVIGVNAQHHGGIKKDFTLADLFIDCGFKSKAEANQYVHIGDYIVYESQPDTLMNRYLTARGLDNRTGAFIVAEVLRKLKEKNCNVGVYAASTVNEETNMSGAYFAAAGIQPNVAIATDVTFATDYPTVDKQKHGDVRLEQGPVIAKGNILNKKIIQLLEQAAKEENIPLQYELVNEKTHTDVDLMLYTNKGVPSAMVSLPLRYMHAPLEVVSFKDLEYEINLLVKMIANLTGEEKLSPLAEI